MAALSGSDALADRLDASSARGGAVGGRAGAQGFVRWHGGLARRIVEDDALPRRVVLATGPTPSASRGRDSVPRPSGHEPLEAAVARISLRGRSSLGHQDLREGSAAEAFLFDDVELEVLFELS